MVCWISTNFFHISDNTYNDNRLLHIGYKDIDEDFITKIIKDDKIKIIQISKLLPKKPINQ